MALDLEEQEQLESLKAWWRQNGKWLVTGLAVFLLAVGGWRAWQFWTAKEAAAASMLFERVMQAAAQNDTKAIKEVSAQIMERYPRSAYSAPAAWLAGRVNYDAGDLKSARAQFQFALDHAGDASLEQLARLRLAALLLDDKDYAGALKLVEAEPAPAYAGLYAHLKGDIYAAQDKRAEARAAYQLALQKLGEESPMKPLVEIKLDSLGG